MACISHSYCILVLKKRIGLIEFDLVFFNIPNPFLLVPLELKLHSPTPV